MTDQTKSRGRKPMVKKTRRKVLMGLAAGAPVLWTKPLVNMVILPVHAQASPTFECEITGPTSIPDIIDGGPLPGPYVYTITNIGTGPLTSGDSFAGPNSGTFSPSIQFGDVDPVPDPFLPGDSVILTIINIGIAFFSSCPPTGGEASMTVGFSSDQTECELVIPLTCSVTD